MKFKNFFASILATALFFIFATATFATDPGKTNPPGKSSTKTDPGKNSTTINTASAEELGSYVRSHATVINVLPESNSIRYTSGTYYLDGNDLQTTVSVTYQNSDLINLFITTQNRGGGLQTFKIDLPENKVIPNGEGKMTASWAIMELNRVNNLSTDQQKPYLQQPTGTITDPQQTQNASSDQTAPASSGSQNVKSKKLQK